MKTVSLSVHMKCAHVAWRSRVSEQTETVFSCDGQHTVSCKNCGLYVSESIIPVTYDKMAEHMKVIHAEILL